jgi:hypothetical protein
MIHYYFYEGQLRSYLLQFCNIFAGLQVKTGKGECDAPEMMTVPIFMGSRDRVVAAIQAGNTQNKPFAVPALAANLTALNLSPNRKGIGVVDRKVHLPAGGAFPNDLTTLTRVMPIPYTMSVDLTLYASNTEQLHQMLEQILVLFDPTLQIQKTDSAFDWTKITTVELTGINNEENYPASTDRRIINWSLNFEMPIYLSLPGDLRKQLVEKIFIQLGDLDGFVVGEVDENGNVAPFTADHDYGTTVVEYEP